MRYNAPFLTRFSPSFMWLIFEGLREIRAPFRTPRFCDSGEYRNDLRLMFIQKTG
jgi:hypothetical protein